MLCLLGLGRICGYFALALRVFADALGVRLMIVVYVCLDVGLQQDPDGVPRFTSTAFTTWVADHVQEHNDATFNPYLTFLFWALYV